MSIMMKIYLYSVRKAHRSLQFSYYISCRGELSSKNIKRLNGIILLPLIPSYGNSVQRPDYGYHLELFTCKSGLMVSLNVLFSDKSGAFYQMICYPQFQTTLPTTLDLDLWSLRLNLYFLVNINQKLSTKSVNSRFGAFSAHFDYACKNLFLNIENQMGKSYMFYGLYSEKPTITTKELHS